MKKMAFVLFIGILAVSFVAVAQASAQGVIHYHESYRAYYRPVPRPRPVVVMPGYGHHHHRPDLAATIVSGVLGLAAINAMANQQGGYYAAPAPQYIQQPTQYVPQQQAPQVYAVQVPVAPQQAPSATTTTASVTVPTNPPCNVLHQKNVWTGTQWQQMWVCQ